MKTVPYDKHSKSRDAEVSGPVLMLVGLAVELERDYEETRRRSRMPRWAARPSAMCVQCEKTASGEYYTLTLTSRSAVWFQWMDVRVHRGECLRKQADGNQ